MEQLSIQPVREMTYYHKQPSKNGMGLSWSGLGGRRRNWERGVEEGTGGGDCLHRERWMEAKEGEAPWKRDRVMKEIQIGKGEVETVKPGGTFWLSG